MKYAIISDIHGNLEALGAVAEDIEARDVNRVFFLGDAVGYAADPQKCIALIDSLCDLMIAGNHDKIAATSLGMDDLNPAALASLRWTIDTITSDEVRWLRRLSMHREENGMYLVHGHPDRPHLWRYMETEKDAADAFAQDKNRIQFVGHTHRPLVFCLSQGEIRHIDQEGGPIRIEQGCRYILNPGSVGQPRDGDPRAAYGLLDMTEGTFTVHRVSYDIEGAAKKIYESGLPRDMGERLFRGE
jgi:diadenosine tetraphosphatase ApaH/serine/threonine PP2A family protein phosphatase